METQNNNFSSQALDSELSLTVKILLVLGGIVAAISAVALVLLTGNTAMDLLFGIVYTGVSLYLSYKQKAEIRYALVTPLYFAGICLIGVSAKCVWDVSFSTLWMIIALLAIPTLLLTGDKMQRHLATAQFGIFLPLGPAAMNHWIVFPMVLVVLSVYVFIIYAEDRIRQDRFWGPELRTLRIALLLLTMGLTIWGEQYGFITTNVGIMSILISLILLPLTFLASDRPGLAMSILFLIYALSFFYYSMEIDLLNKSLLLMGCGAVFLAAFFVIKKQNNIK